jgi:phosphatidylserine/phosphatidylglycerophosphate/cardiolipin synthase-like enzyme
MARDLDGAIAERSRKLLGLLTVAQLNELGVSRQRRRTLVAAGVLVPVHRGVYRHRAHPQSWAQSVLAATLAAGPAAVASHETAARVWRLDGFVGPAARSVPIQLTVPRGSAPAPGPGVEVHRARDLVPADVEQRRLIRVTTAARTLIDIAPFITPVALEAALDDAEQRGLVWRRFLEWRLESLGGRGRAGVPQVRALVDRTEGRPLGDSWLEQQAIRIVTQAGLPVPRCQVHVRRPDRKIARVDLVWDVPRLVAELAGQRSHATRRQRQADAERAANLVLAGYRVLEFTYEDVTERPDYVVATIATHLKQVAA